jgi:two-component sensor histidine kinase
MEVLDGRIHSLALTHALLSRGRWQGVSLEEIVRCELAPCVERDSTILGGPNVVLVAEATQSVAMVIHELITNAAKYGSLSIPQGRVSVCWNWRPNGTSHGRLVVEWQEMDGPSVIAPVKSGYGTSVIRDLIPYELGGTVDQDFAPEGVRCTLSIPMEWLSVGESDSLNEGASSRQRHTRRRAALLP